MEKISVHITCIFQIYSYRWFLFVCAWILNPYFYKHFFSLHTLTYIYGFTFLFVCLFTKLKNFKEILCGFCSSSRKYLFKMSGMCIKEKKWFHIFLRRKSNFTVHKWLRVIWIFFTVFLIKKDWHLWRFQAN